MSVRASIAGFGPLFAAALLLLTGHGLQLTLIPLRAEVIGFTAVDIGVAGSSYFLGFLLGCLLTPAAISRLGYVGGFAISAVITGVALIAYSQFDSLSAWLLLRFVSGIGVAGFYTIIEAWINAGAVNEVRGRVLSLYVVTNLVVVTIGQWLINLAPVSGIELFVGGASLMLLGLLPFIVLRSNAPIASLGAAGVDVVPVWRRSPVAFVVTSLSGVITGGFWTLGPVYAHQLELSTWQISLFMSVVIVAGALFQYPLGRASDVVDRRTVLNATLIGVAISGGLLATPYAEHAWVLYAAVFVWGGCALSVYGQCIAHANDEIKDGRFVQAASALLVLWGLGAIAGPWLTSLLMAIIGPGGLFLTSALAGACALVGSLWVDRRMHSKPISGNSHSSS